MIVYFLINIFNSYDKVLEVLLSCGLIETVMTFGVMNEFSLKEVFNKVLMDVMLTFGGEWFFECFEE